MRIKGKILLGFILVILIMIVVDLSVFINNKQLVSKINKLELSNRTELSQSNTIAYNIVQIKSDLLGLFFQLKKTGNEQHKKEQIANSKQLIENRLQNLSRSLNILIEATDTGVSLAKEEEEEEEEKDELVLLGKLSNKLAIFSSSVNDIFGFQYNMFLEEAERLFETETIPISNEIQKLIIVIKQDAQDEVGYVIGRLSSQANYVIRLGIYLTMLSIALAIAIGVYISNSISSPINKLIARTKEISKGNFDAKVEIRSSGELQALANAFNNMTQELNDKISSINKLNEELQDSNDTKDTFFSIISHDLRSPFNVIIGYSDLLATYYDDFDDEKRKLFIQDIHKSSKNTFELLENLLTWARSQSGKIIINKEKVNLSLLIGKCIKNYSQSAFQKNIELQNDVPDNLCVEVDKFSMSVVINNIISNAIKFTPNGGKVFIIAETENEKIKVKFRDTGIGIKKEVIENLAQSKAIVSSPGTNNEKGTGIGLVLIDHFIKKNGAYLDINSIPGEGSEFNITFLT